tara:strand:+ start:320 stop:1504 length:1185 start_codon:yes stop_codon:yes gene_type:complete
LVKNLNFKEHLIDDTFMYVYGISSLDITGNGFLDLIAVDTNIGLYWYENDGDGNFSKHVIHEKRGEWLERHTIADINNDGKPEIIFVDNIGGSLLWFEFDGDPRDKKSWNYHYVSERDFPSAYDVAAGDINNDGKLELAASAYVHGGNKFSWFEKSQGCWVQHLIEENIPETRTVELADFTNNGFVDLLGCSTGNGQVIVYRNLGNSSKNRWEKHIIDIFNNPRHGHAADLNNDGNMDILMTGSLPLDRNRTRTGSPLSEESELHLLSQEKVVWYENPGSSDFSKSWKKHLIHDGIAGFEAIAADLDNDGQLEVVVSTLGPCLAMPSGGICVFKHRGDPKGVWDMKIIKDDWNEAHQLLTLDVNSNGLKDIVGVANCATPHSGKNELRWWENLG